MKENLKMFSLEGKAAVITGGAGVLGSALARGLGKAGAKIALCDIVNADKVAQKLESEGIEAKGYYINVMDIEKIKICRGEVIRDFGKIDILLNAAGGNMKEATTSKELKFFDKVRDELRSKYPNGGFVVIKDDAVLGIWMNRTDALKVGIEKFGNVPFLVKNINDNPGRQLNFTRNIQFPNAISYH